MRYLGVIPLFYRISRSRRLTLAIIQWSYRSNCYSVHYRSQYPTIREYTYVTLPTVVGSLTGIGMVSLLIVCMECPPLSEFRRQRESTREWIVWRPILKMEMWFDLYQAEDRPPRLINFDATRQGFEFKYYFVNEYFECTKFSWGHGSQQ